MAADAVTDVSESFDRLAHDVDERTKRGREARQDAEGKSFDAVADELDAVYARLTRKRRLRATEDVDPLAGRDRITIDLHIHTDWSHDCSIPAEELVDNAEAIGLGGIAVTDHNAFGGALDAVELAGDRDLVVIPGPVCSYSNPSDNIRIGR